MKPTLLVLAAGMASRYGSMKQIQQFGPGGETIMDYSIFDAIRAGFGKVVFIIRKDFEADFREIFDKKLEGKIAVDYVFQELGAHLGDFELPADRVKPWGTAHAVLCAADKVKEPFAVINADDFYGKDAFEKAAKFLTTECDENTYAIVGYDLIRTLSDHGSVSRGVVQVDDANNMVSIRERTKIYPENGHIVFEEEGAKFNVASDSKVSMNFWCFHPSVFEVSEEMFHDFLKENISNPKSEFFIPIVADQFIANKGGKIKVIPTSSQWFGVTYKEDAPMVIKGLNSLVTDGEYPENVWI